MPELADPPVPVLRFNTMDSTPPPIRSWTCEVLLVCFLRKSLILKYLPPPPPPRWISPSVCSSGSTCELRPLAASPPPSQGSPVHRAPCDPSPPPRRAPSASRWSSSTAPSRQPALRQSDQGPRHATRSDSTTIADFLRRIRPRCRRACGNRCAPADWGAAFLRAANAPWSANEPHGLPDVAVAQFSGRSASGPRGVLEHARIDV